jgi:hypothetical protein
MFETTSRYYTIEEGTITGSDNRTIRFRRRRFLPQGSGMPLLTRVTFLEEDRLDTITARVLGDPLQFWRICDANDAMHPDELTARADKALRVAAPRF